MSSKRNRLSMAAGVAAFVLILAPSAFAKKPKSGGTANVPCGDGVITYSPATLWPPNHKMKSIAISFAESEATSDSDTIGLQINDITSSQQAEDDAGGNGCGKPTATQGPDFSFDGKEITGPDTTPLTTSVEVRAERCAKVMSARVYTIEVTCSDEGDTDTVPLTITVAHHRGRR